MKVKSYLMMLRSVQRLASFCAIVCTWGFWISSTPCFFFTRPFFMQFVHVYHLQQVICFFDRVVGRKSECTYLQVHWIQAT